MTAVWIVAAVFVAALLQSLAGFGFAILVMPLATLALGLRTAAPLVALAGLTIYAIHVARYFRAVDVRELVRLAAGSALGIPVGIWVLGSLDESLVTRVLGLILFAYGLYTLLRRGAPRPLSQRWVYPSGFLAGCLGGAYNTPGPPVIVYGSMRQWPKGEFRAVLQSLFFFNAILVVASHLVARHLTAGVLRYYLYALPALLLGIGAGAILDRRVDHARFRTLVTAMIVALGLVLALGIA